MDIKHVFEKYGCITGITDDMNHYKKSSRIILSQAKDYEFRTTVIKGIHTYHDIEDIVQSIDGAKRYILQSFRP